jgi:hypothetical protein
MANDASMIFRIKGDASHVKRELSTLGVSASRTVGTLGKGLTGALQGNFSALSGGISSVTGGLSMLGPKGMIAAAAIGAVAGAASAAAGSIFALTKEAAAYAGTIMDAMEKTGLGAETLTALDYAAKISGSSIEEVSSSIIKFSRLAGEAALGSEEAAKKLEMFGVTPREAMTDLDGALSKVFRRIMSLPPGTQRGTAAFQAFGKSGANLLPMLNTLDGDLEGFIEKAREVGMVMDDQTVIALDAFDENLQRIQAQFGGLTRQIGAAFLPMFMEMATEVSNFLKENQDEIKQIAKDASGFFRVVLKGLKDVVDFVRENQWAWTLIKTAFAPLAAGSAMLSLGRSFNQTSPTLPTGTDEGTKNRVKELEGEIEQEQKLREQQENRRLKALTETRRLEIDMARKMYQVRYNELLEAYNKERITKEEFNNLEMANLSTMIATITVARGRQHAIDLANEDLTLEERYNLQVKYDMDTQELKDFGLLAERKRYEAIDQMDKLHAARALARARGNFQRSQRDSQENLQVQMMNEQIAFEKGERTMKEFVENTGKFRRAAINDQIKIIDELLEVLALEKATQEEIIAVEAERKALVRERDVIIVREEELDRIRRTKDEARELLELQRQSADVAADIKEQNLRAQIQDKEAAIAREKNAKIRATLLLDLQRLENDMAKLNKDRAMEELERWRADSLKRIKGKDNEEAQKLEIEKIYQERRVLGEEEFQRRLKEIKGKYETEASGTAGGFFGSFKKWLEEGRKSLENFEGVMASFGDIVFKAFMQIQEGLGAALEQWVLTGETGPAVMKKILAATLATMAKDMAMKAMYYTALGFGLLAIKDFAGAAQSFKAAALFGAGSAAAAFAGRALAGDTFKKESGRESVSGRQSNNTGTQGQAFSSMQEQTVDVNRAASFGAIQRETVVVVKDKSGMFSKLFQVEMEKNSKVRQTIMRTA